MAEVNQLKRKAGECLQRKDLRRARELFGRVLRHDPGDLEAWLALAGVHWMAGEPAEAENCCRRAIALDPAVPGAWLNLASALSAQGHHAEAAQGYRRVLELQPGNLVAWQCLGNSLRRADAHGEAVAVFRRALALQPEHAGIHYDLGNTFKALGDIPAAVASFRRALAARPDDRLAHTNLVSCLLYDADTTPEALFAEQRRWGRVLEASVVPGPPPDNDPDPGRPLRLGYCSPDLREHSVAWFIEGLLEHHDRGAFEVVCYADVERPDRITARLRKLADRWRDCAGLGDEEVYARVRADGIDILVDLAGLTQGNRMGVFARRAAPVQINYLGYAASTGLERMDYRLTDARADPPGLSEHCHSETLVRLPRGFLCYRPPEEAPAVASLPLERCGRLTFGSFNDLAKVTPAVVALWARVLRAVPGSRLLCKARRLADPSIRRRYLQLFAAHGIGAERLELLGPVVSTAAHLALYGRVDIALDTFPYNGTTTTCEALWMGVPVLTLEGDRHLARVGLSILHQLGLEEWVARDDDDFVALASRLAADPVRLAAVRAALRARLAASPLCDATTFTRDLETVYRRLWSDWCERGRR